MAEYKHMVPCFLCQRDVQFGPHVYDAKAVPQWGIYICRSCKAGNWDGIVLEMHPRLKAHLEKHGIPIKLNAKGWLDIP